MKPEIKTNRLILLGTSREKPTVLRLYKIYWDSHGLQGPCKKLWEHIIKRTG